MKALHVWGYAIVWLLLLDSLKVLSLKFLGDFMEGGKKIKAPRFESLLKNVA
ncbi:MAG: hypothetical protein ACOC10_09340 [Bacteroidota bacterium]